MKKLFTYLFVAITLIIAGCSESFDDSKIWEKLDDHENRITQLEELCKQMNTNIASLQTIVNALQNNDYVTSVTPITKDGDTVGYTITFTKSQPITIYNGKDGKDGQNGADGKDGQDGYTPQIGVMKDTDDCYYWTVDGEWLLDGKGNKVKAVGQDGTNGSDGKDGVDGEDGKDGANGNDGQDGITPRLKIENDYWYVSYDEGSTWIELGKATGDDGADGSDGADGADGDSIFTSVTQDDEYVYFNLADGTIITLPKHNDDINEEEPVFTIDGDGNYVVEAEGGTIKVKVSTNLEYSVHIPEDAKVWLSVADTRAIRNETLTFTVAKNEMIGERQAAVKIKGTDGTLLESIVFIQKDESTGGSISVSKGKVSFDFEGGECELTVNAEYSWVATCSADWITLQTPDGIAGEEPLKFIVKLNATLSQRTATITLKNENYSLIQEVYVVQTEFAPIIIVDEESLSLEYAACEKFIGVTSNVEYNVTDDADWLTCEVVEGGINLSVTSNGTLETRSAQVIITAKENPEALAKLRLVTQASADIQNTILYTSSDGKTIKPVYTDVFGANIIGNSYIDNQGILIFDGPITSIGEGAFYYCTSLTSITIPDSVTSIGEWAFYYCTSLTSITIPDSVTSIGEWAFAYCALTSITIPDSVTSIGHATFSNCTSLTSITIPDSVTSIGEWAFAYCALTSITIPDSVTSIGDKAFYNCSSLRNIYCRPTTPPAIFYDSDYVTIPKTVKIYVPAESYALYTQYSSGERGTISQNNWYYYKSCIISE